MSGLLFSRNAIHRLCDHGFHTATELKRLSALATIRYNLVPISIEIGFSRAVCFSIIQY